jgi:predicted dehydrogenase
VVKVALVGAAHIHTPGFIKRLLARTDVQTAYVWDHDAARAARAAETLNAPAVADVNTLWSDPEVKAVVICSETDRHGPLVRDAAKAGKHMFVEKPLALGSADAFPMAEAVRETGVLFQTGYFQRGIPAHQFLREEIRQGHLGKITRLRMSNCHSGSMRGLFDSEWAWMADLKQAGGGGFFDLGTHSLDIMLWLLGDVKRVTATLGVATGRYGETDEFGEGLLEFTNGAVGSLAAGWVDVAHPVGLILSGTEGHAYIANGQLYYQSSHVAGADGKEPWTQLPEAWPHAFELFLDAVVGKDAPLVDVREAAVRSAVMEALYEGARTHQWVSPAC